MVTSKLMEPPSDEPQIGADTPDDGGMAPGPSAASRTPSVYLYRGALVALAVGTLVAVFLVLRPPADESEQQVVRNVATSTPTPVQTATATPIGQLPTATATALPATPTPDEPTPTATPEPGEVEEYTVQSGDFLSSIAAARGTTVDAILELNPGLEADKIAVGEIILVPSQ